MEQIGLESIARWVISGGAGIIVAWLIEHYGLFASMKPEPKRLVVYGLLAVFGCIAWGILLLASFDPLPIGWVAWIDGLLQAAFTAITTGGIAHGRMVLSRR